MLFSEKACFKPKAGENLSAAGANLARRMQTNELSGEGNFHKMIISGGKTLLAHRSGVYFGTECDPPWREVRRAGSTTLWMAEWTLRMAGWIVF